MTEEQRRKKCAYTRLWKKINRDKKQAYERKWRLNNPDKIRAIGRKTRLKNGHKYAARKRVYYKTNRKKLLAVGRLWVLRNLDKVRAYKRKYDKERCRTDLHYHLKKILRTRIWFAIKSQNARKHSKTIKLLGCSIINFKIYIESRFEPGMSWDNYGKWEIDHIIPCDIFDLTRPEHQRACFHFSNLQPMWAPKNRSKGSKYESSQLSPEIARLVNS